MYAWTRDTSAIADHHLDELCWGLTSLTVSLQKTNILLIETCNLQCCEVELTSNLLLNSCSNTTILSEAVSRAT